MSIFVEYALIERNTPDWISDGGYWINPENNKMIGVAEGSIPDSIETFTLEELQARLRAIHANYPVKVIDGRRNVPDLIDMTEDQVNAAIKEWVDAR